MIQNSNKQQFYAQTPPRNNEDELREEEDLNLALALSQSEAEAKEKEKLKVTSNYGAPKGTSSHSILNFNGTS